MSTHPQTRKLTNGRAGAATLAAGIGSCALGLFTILAAASEAIKEFLNFYKPAGALSGKTTLAVLIWLVAWVVLHSRWKDKEVNFQGIFTWTLILIALALLGTFPPFFELFE
jgi:hypothetical protein